MLTQIHASQDELAAFCRQHHILRLAFFGSVTRDDFRADSDVDVLAEFEPEHIPGLFALGRMQAELSQLLGGREVDLVTPKFLNHRIRQRVLDSAEVVYAG